MIVAKFFGAKAILSNKIMQTVAY